MFNLECKDVMLKNLTTRTEKHGHEEVPAASLTCEITLPNTVLDKFDTRLLKAFYEKKDAEQGELIEDESLRDLRFDKMKPISWNDEYDSVRVTLVNDLNHDEARFIFPECKVKSFKFEMKDGGSVNVCFTINCRPEGSELGWLYDHQKKNILMTIEPPAQETLEGFDGFEEASSSDEPKEETDEFGRDPRFEMAIDYMRNTEEPNVKALGAYFQIPESKAQNLMNQLEKACLVSKRDDGSYHFNELAETE